MSNVPNTANETYTENENVQLSPINSNEQAVKKVRKARKDKGRPRGKYKAKSKVTTPQG